MQPPSPPAFVLALALPAAFLAACGDDAPSATPTAPEFSMPADPHSFAAPEGARVRHLALDLAADFAVQRLHGTATLDVERRAGAAEIVLDTERLAVDAVTDGAGRALEWRLGEPDPVRGRPLSVALPEGVDRIVVRYATAPDAPAVQWLAPRQTASRRPFLFTQGQAILTRSWIPLQDTPGVRQTWEASIVAGDGLTAVMSGEMQPPEDAADGRRRFRFAMRHPVPSYLIALAIGDLEFRPLGPRSGVYAEPPVVDAAAAEFVDVERMMAAAERLYGPYRWGRYDVLVLPPAFPFGGMENPCLTFATPTILAGDRSLVALIAHELAHSWSGNLVTNATWDDLWLNEGFTVYFENRIMEELFGRPHAEMLQVIGWQDLQEDLDQLGRAHPDTRLHHDLAGRNSDDAFSDVPYEKGALLLRRLEEAVGRERFDGFLADYFERFAFQPMTAARFSEHVDVTLFAARPELRAEVEYDAWVHGPGLPASARAPRSSELERVDLQRRRFAEGAAAADLDVGGFTTHHWLHLLRRLPESLAAERLDDLDQAFGLSTTGNSEILFEWLRIAVRNRHAKSFAALEDFLVRQGRRKFLKPLYQDLMKSDWGAALAREIYAKARPGYHAVSSHTIDGIVGAPAGSTGTGGDPPR